MSIVRFNTTVDSDLLEKAKETAFHEGLEGANAVIEKALRLYFANYGVTVWEKELQGGWVKKLVVRPDKVVFQSIRQRKVSKSYNPTCFSDEALETKGFKRVWKLKTA